MLNMANVAAPRSDLARLWIEKNYDELQEHFFEDFSLLRQGKDSGQIAR